MIVKKRIIENEDGSKTKKMDIIADKVSFISSYKGNKDVVKDTNNENDNLLSNNLLDGEDTLKKESNTDSDVKSGKKKK